MVENNSDSSSIGLNTACLLLLEKKSKPKKKKHTQKQKAHTSKIKWQT